jgi:ribosomal protein S18 acetylase RimI-like enzyme
LRRNKIQLTFKNNRQLDIKQLEKLYIDVEWYAYTKDLESLQQALNNSLEVISAWNGDELVGLIRAVGDGLTILYIQDILVLNAYQNQGIATQLMEKMIVKYNNVRQKVLLTEEAPDVRHFYEKNNFQSCDQGDTVAFAKFS